MQQNLSVLKKIKNYIFSFFLSKVGYYNGTLYQINYIKKKLEVVDDFTPIFLIVANEYYHEESIKLPVAESSEIAKLIKLEKNDTNALLIASKLPDATFVNKWSFSFIPVKSLFYIPESFVFAKLVSNNHIIKIVSGPERDFFVTRLRNNIITSARKHGWIDSFERFSMSIGVINQRTEDITAENLAVPLISGIKGIKFLELFPFLKINRNIDFLSVIKNLLLPGFLLFTCFLMISSLLIFSRGIYLEQQVNQMKNELSYMLVNNDEFEIERTKYESLYSIFSNKNNHLALYITLAPVFDIATLSSVRFELGRYIIQGETEQASDLLELISSQVNVVNAKFDLPVTKNGARERFTMSFLVNPNQIKIPLVESKNE
ncbi:hypothetical protein [Pseudoalteromonas tunicata]|jgi:hypothetical protein|uniref:General secretion pathway protein L n=1 Tax=Pseudoalteromonas tunicata D2 TaxID=87626 RepID=A4C8H5_9GAMM|nr:hypothetical protein [Pseudoalteromonas tunicata]ATC93394.1 hypothetical protein PTUN_a0627 [Pseudoalteromonas tunicata]AXT32438.1 hypothetical protein D1819_17465 [Pseudoalteromonas tunicata]EAR28890.1 hypothetical protein PTD2_07599 [Pseudoalteromonas tunicata D2]